MGANSFFFWKFFFAWFLSIRFTPDIPPPQIRLSRNEIEETRRIPFLHWNFEMKERQVPALCHNICKIDEQWREIWYNQWTVIFKHSSVAKQLVAKFELSWHVVFLEPNVSVSISNKFRLHQRDKQTTNNTLTPLRTTLWLIAWICPNISLIAILFVNN